MSTLTRPPVNEPARSMNLQLTPSTNLIRVRWDAVITAIFCAALGFTLGITAATTVMTAAVKEHVWPACANEDSRNCFWDAAHRGNGQGISFVDVNGVQYTAGQP